MSKQPRWKPLLSGAVGACALTLLHEAARRKVPDAPRVHRLGMRAITKVLNFLGKKEPGQDQLFRWALIGDLVSNSLFYSAVGKGDSSTVWQRGAMLGISAGLGTVALPEPLGLGKEPSNRTPATQVMTVLWYLMGGLVAAGTSRLLTGDAANAE
ncbi:MAG TPA: hypothetical protein VF600_00095 [Abditibacteriaceae bacterium]|jgi:hypothetical protein